MIPAKAVLDTTKASFAMEGMYATGWSNLFCGIFYISNQNKCSQ